MTVQHVTIGLSDTLHQQVRQRARRMHRSAEEVLAVVEDGLPVLDALLDEISGELDQLAVLTDHGRRNAARASTTVTENQRMQAPLLKQHAVELSPDELAEAENRTHRQERVMLLRVRATTLLKRRGQHAALNPRLRPTVSGEGSHV